MAYVFLHSVFETQFKTGTLEGGYRLHASKTLKGARRWNKQRREICHSQNRVEAAVNRAAAEVGGTKAAATVTAVVAAKAAAGEAVAGAAVRTARVARAAKADKVWKSNA
jgi:hypothetical protein